MYVVFFTSVVALIIFKYVFLDSNVNINNRNVAYLSVKNLLPSRQKGLLLAINVVTSVCYGVLMDLLYFQLPLLNEAKRHQSSTINDSFVFYYGFALLVGVFNTLYQLWTNDNVVNVNLKFDNSVSSLLAHYARHGLLARLGRYVKSLGGFVAVYSLLFRYVKVVTHRFLSVFVGVKNQGSDAGFFSLSNSFFVAKLVAAYVVLQLLIQVGTYVFFNSYILLGCVHFHQPISSYSVKRTQLVFDNLVRSTGLTKITILQEIGYLADTKNKEFYEKFSSFYETYFSQADALLKQNVAKLETKKKHVSTQGPQTNPKKSSVPILQQSVFQKQKTSFLSGIFSSLFSTFINVAQDKSSAESYLVINFLKKQACFAWTGYKYLAGKVSSQLNLDKEFALIESIPLYYYLINFTIIIKNTGSVDNKLNNKILSNINQILDLLYQSIRFTEDYPLRSSIATEQVTNPVLMAELHQELVSTFKELVSKYRDILSELSLNENVLKLSKQYLSEPVVEEAGEYTFEVSVNY